MNIPVRSDKLAQQVAVKSAVNPTLWAGLVFSLPLFILASNTNGWLSICYFIIAVIPIILFAYSYLFLLHTNPEYIRSEEYQLTMNAMRFMGDKDNPNIENADEVTPSENPELSAPRKKQQQT